MYVIEKGVITTNCATWSKVGLQTVQYLADFSTSQPWILASALCFTSNYAFLDPPEALDLQPEVKPVNQLFEVSIYLSIPKRDIFWCWTTTVASSDPKKDPEKKTWHLWPGDSAVVDLFQDHQAFHLMAEERRTERLSGPCLLWKNDENAKKNMFYINDSNMAYECIWSHQKKTWEYIRIIIYVSLVLII